MRFYSQIRCTGKLFFSTLFCFLWTVSRSLVVVSASFTLCSAQFHHFFATLYIYIRAIADTKELADYLMLQVIN